MRGAATSGPDGGRGHTIVEHTTTEDDRDEEAAAPQLDVDASAPPSGGARPWQSIRNGVERHPLIAVCIVASVVALGHAVWIWTHRRVGAYDPDEAGYIAASLRFQRSIDPLHPLDVVRAVMSSGNGPMVPLASVLLLLPGPRDPRTVMMIQPLLLVFTCVAVGGITRRMAGPVAAFATGCAFLAFPTASLATQSYWLGLGAAAGMAGATWALFSSERCTNRWTLAYGAGIAMMAMARTMALGFVPGLLLAGAVMAGRDRRSWIGLARGVLVALVLAGPWYVLQRTSIFGYLIDYGYGERAGLFGSGGPWDRLSFRFDRISGDVGRGITLTALLVVATTVPPLFWRWRRDGSAPTGGRELAAITTTVVVGLAALVSTSNNGVWFELPLIVLLVALVGALAARALLVLRLALVVQLVGQLVLMLALTWWLVPPRLDITAHYEEGFAQYDDRYGPGRRDEQPAAARDWARLSSQVERELHRLDGGTGLDTQFEVSGNMQLFNSNTLALAGELQGWGPTIRIPDTTVGAEARAAELEPTASGPDGRTVERIIVIAEHDHILFTPDADVASFERQALDAGWTVRSTFDMPGGGQVRILRHDDPPG